MEEEELFSPKTHLKSAVWDFFGYQKKDQVVIVEDGLPKCKICHKKAPAG